MSPDRIRAAFLDQAGHCRRMGSGFTALVCDVFLDCLDASTPLGQRVLGWPGDPMPLADNVPLRVAGALHALARSGSVPPLTAVYPPHAMPSAAQLATAIRAALDTHADTIDAYLDSPPQTNEVGRSAALLAGWLDIAAATRLPLALYEIGSSAGLNLIADRYQYRFGSTAWGRPDAALLLAPEWTGEPPPVDAGLRVVSRRGCDLSPIDLSSDEARRRLVSYVWADQRDRLARIEAAIDAARTDPPAIDRAEAAAWVRDRIPVAPPGRLTRVLFHSVVWQYLPPATQTAIETHLREAGKAATSDSPLAWLRFELNGEQSGAALRLRLWPGGEDRLLATAHAHGASIYWAS